MEYLRRHWRGELGFGVSFWLNGALPLMALLVLAEILSPIANRLPGSYNAAIFAGLAILLSMGLLAWQGVGIWRAATREPAARRRRLQGLAVALALVQGAALAFHQVPPLREGLALGAVLQQIGQWQIALRNDGHDIEISGGVGAGIAEDFARTLEKAPDLRLVHLNLRHGGLVSEAMRLADLIRARGLDTYTTDRCVSACTIVYLAGRNRYLREGAELGFHAFVAPGAARSEAVQGVLLRAAGVAPAFIARAMQTPHNTVWYPAAEELRAAAVVTEIVDGADFAASGFRGMLSDAELADELAEIRLFDVLREREPEAFREVLGITRAVVNAGKPVNAARGLMAPVLEGLRDKYLRFADDNAVISLYRTMIGQATAIAEADSALCYRHLMAPVASSGDRARIRSILGASLGTYEFDAIADLIATADPARIQPAKADLRPLTQAVIRQVATRHGAAEFTSTFDGSIADPGEGCAIVLDFFQTILSLPPDSSAKLLRSLGQAKG